jgi:predicted DNA-binding protein/mRNA-degrading endonuclease RelE of RelBE toxin-antitoxin system
MSVSTRLDPEIERRLDQLASQTGRAKSYYLRELIVGGLDDLEDFYLADATMERVRKGSEKVLTAAKVRKGLGLDHSLHRVCQQATQNIRPAFALRVLDYMDRRVATLDDPRSLGKNLVGPKMGKYWRYRAGDIRIICDIADQQMCVLVIEIGNRKEVYR